MKRLDDAGTENKDGFEGLAEMDVFGFAFDASHMTRPRSVPSAPAPETKTKIIRGFRRESV